MSRIFDIPDDLARTNAEVHGQAGIEWIDRLPALLAECERRWSLTFGPPFPLLSYNYAAPAIRADGSPLVVKACFPNRDFECEAEALKLYAGRGAVQLIEADLEQGILLLERLEPGMMLYTIEDDERATSIAAMVMKQLWRLVPANHSFPSVVDWADGLNRLRKRFGGTTGPLSEKLVDQAERLFAELLGSQDEPVVLHGDLHHFNILSTLRQPQDSLWLAIDPKGVIGEPAYETGALLRNPTPDLVSWPDLGQILTRRVDQLAEELGFDRGRVRGWGIAQAVESAWWDIEDHGRGWEIPMAVAEALSAHRS